MLKILYLDLNIFEYNKIRDKGIKYFGLILSKFNNLFNLSLIVLNYFL